MINLTANIPIVKDVPRITKWEVKGLPDDRDDEGLLVVRLKLYGPGDIAYTGVAALVIRDNSDSCVLRINASPTSSTDQFSSVLVTLPGTPYTALTAAMYAATGKNNMRKAVENLLVSVGAMPAEFAGT